MVGGYPSPAPLCWWPSPACRQSTVNRSTNPSVWGWYAVVLIFFIPITAHNSCTKSCHSSCGSVWSSNARSICNSVQFLPLCQNIVGLRILYWSTGVHHSCHNILGLDTTATLSGKWERASALALCFPVRYWIGKSSSCKAKPHLANFPEGWGVSSRDRSASWSVNIMHLWP